MANFNLNKAIIGGRLCADPELKQTPSGVSVVNLRVAVNRRIQPKDGETAVYFIDVTAWRQTADFISKYFRKGSSICIVGSIQTRTWTDQNGGKRYATDVVADEAYFVDSKFDGQIAPAAYVPEAYTTPELQDVPNFTENSDEDDLPF